MVVLISSLGIGNLSYGVWEGGSYSVRRLAKEVGKLSLLAWRIKWSKLLLSEHGSGQSVSIKLAYDMWKISSYYQIIW